MTNNDFDHEYEDVYEDQSFIEQLNAIEEAYTRPAVWIGAQVEEGGGK